MIISHELAVAAIILATLLLLLGVGLIGVFFYGAGYDKGFGDGLEEGDLNSSSLPRNINFSSERRNEKNDRVSDEMVRWQR